MSERLFTRQELSQYNGAPGKPVLIAFEGKVYDVSKSFLWRKGKHQATHVAGVDLTGFLPQAPHSADMLKKFPVVGRLRDDE